MNNIKGYNKFSKNKKVSELFLGTLNVNWEFAKIGYTATCTEALPLTFLEKMVCGIADLDGKVNLGNLAHIMGFNIENDVQNLKFQDNGETEILLETLRTLKQFGVITTPDDSFSSIELTEIGKEYYAKGRKFKQGETKGFTMYFDVTAGEHAKAKELFSKVTIDGSTATRDEQEIPYSDETFVKQYAESQVPQYYSEKTGNSFTDMSVSSREFLYKKVVLGIIYDSFTETYRLEVIDDGGISADYISDYVNSDDNIFRYLGQFMAEQTSTADAKGYSQKEFEESITKVQSDAEYALFNEQPEKALKLVTEFSKAPVYMEKQNLFNFIKSKTKDECAKDVFISLPYMTEDAEAELRSLAENDDVNIMLSCGDLEDFDTRFGENVLVLNGDKDSDIVLMTEDSIYRCEDLVFSIGNASFCVGFLHSQEEDSTEVLEDIRQLFAARFVPYALNKYEELLQNSETDELTDRIAVLNDADNLIAFEDSYVESTGNEEKLSELRAKRDEQLLDLVQKYSSNMLEELAALRANTPLDDIRTLDVMEKAQSAFSALKCKLIPEQSVDNEKGWGSSGVVLALNESISSYESQLNNRENYLRQELLPKNYIIDTNVFVYFPEIMDYVGKDDNTILSLRVLEELDKLKVTLDGKDKRNVKKAIKEINHKIRMKSSTFRMESADSRLLPEDFDKANPDNLILSVALKYKDRNPFLVTCDVNFQNRAASVGIPFKGLSDMLPDDVFKTIDFTQSEKKEPEPKNVPSPEFEKNGKNMPKSLLKMIRKAYKACEEKADDVLVAMLVSAIKSAKPDFKPSTFGFTKFKDLCAAYPSDVELYEDSNHALCIRLVESDSPVASFGTAKSGNIKELDSLSEELQDMLKELLQQMVSEEDSSAPVSDGDIRKAFIKESGVNIKLKPVKQMRESMNIPSAKQRKDNFTNI